MAQLGDPRFLDHLAAHRASDQAYRIFGTDKADPATDKRLWKFITTFVQPFVRSDKTVCEIGCGGGRLTQFLTGFQQIYAVDYHPEMHVELLKHVKVPYLIPIVTQGTDFPGMGLVDYAVSLYTFTYFDRAVIRDYLSNLAPYLKPNADVVFNYAALRKWTKQDGFEQIAVDSLRRLVEDIGYSVRAEDNAMFPDSNVVRLNYQ